MTRQTPLTIATNLNPLQNERLAEHASRPRIIPYTDTRSAWDVPDEADVLMTFFRGWKTAPRDAAPAGWPGRLRFVQIASTGVDAFPSWVFTSGLPVSCARGVPAVAIAEYVLMALLAHEKRLFDSLFIRSAEDWTPRSLAGLSGKTVGLLGLGAIGQAVAERARAFGVKLVALRRSNATPIEGVEIAASLPEMMAASDHLVVALPLTSDTRAILGREAFAAAKPGLHIVNVSRGELIDDDALLHALEAGQVGAATLDVTAPEPLPAGHPFYTHPGIRLSPHVSWMSEDNDDRLTEKLFANLDRFLAGEPLADLVEKGRGY
ncbi:NAD(P)-dependent oxidoreductase [Faunimonas pinastri]|nr:NAD(P)-dependent oxidoreductase [Faunimonas pinastri]